MSGPVTAAPSRVAMVARGLAGALVGVGVAALLAWHLDARPAEVARHLRGVSPGVVAVCALSGFVVLALQSLRWHAVMKPLLGLSYGQAFRAQVVGMMLNALIPARGGDLLRVQYLWRRTGQSRATILGTEIVDRWLDWWGWLPVVAVLALVDRPPAWVGKAVAVFAGLLLAWGGAMMALTRRGYAAREGSRWGAFFASLRRGVDAFRSPRTWFIAFVLAPLPWLWEAFVLSRVTREFGIHLGPGTAFCVLVGFNLAMVVPSPGAVGSMEAGGMAALAFFGVDHSKALAFLFVYHFAQLLPGIAAGVGILVAEREQLFGARIDAAPGTPA